MTRGEQLPDVAVVAIGRWLWRYRSGLAPAGIAAVLYATAWALHRWHPLYWPFVAGFAVIAVVVAVLAGARLGLASHLERWYAAVAAAGGWLALVLLQRPVDRATDPPSW